MADELTPMERAVMLQAKAASSKKGIPLTGDEAKTALDLANRDELHLYPGEGIGEVVVSGVTLKGMQTLIKAAKGE